MRKNRFAEKRKSDKEFYSSALEKYKRDMNDESLTPVQRDYAQMMVGRAMRALDVSRLDPVAAFRVFTGEVL